MLALACMSGARLAVTGDAAGRNLARQRPASSARSPSLAQCMHVFVADQPAVRGSKRNAREQLIMPALLLAPPEV